LEFLDPVLVLCTIRPLLVKAVALVELVLLLEESIGVGWRW
jgi:hypothetical protein